MKPKGIVAFRATFYKLNIEFFSYNMFWLWFALSLVLIPPHLPSRLDPDPFCFSLGIKTAL